jgi:phospholipid/cholesterol/gamma-HCH transport system substrate-binding protein
VKFRVRFADKIVGLLIIAALGFLVFSIFMLGKRHRWFAKDQTYRTHFDSASGLSANMPVQYRGFTIGNVKSFDLTAEDKVEVTFTIYDTYLDRMREGSLVEVRVNPIGIGGGQFLFHPGLFPNPLEGNFIPNAHSEEGREYLEQGLVIISGQDDSITVIISRVNTLLQNLNAVTLQLRDAFRGTDTKTTLGRTVSGLEETVRGASSLVGTVDAGLKPSLQNAEEISSSIERISSSIERITAQAESVAADLQTVTAELASPDGLALRVLDIEGPVYTNLERSLTAISGTLESLESTAGALPSQMSQVEALIQDLRTALTAAEDVIIALRNNPLLKNGIPDRGRPGTGGTSPRDIPF